MAHLIRRVRLRNYKSIAACDVSLEALTILVGRNGSGKSNFVDALRFVVDALQVTLEHALRERGGVDRVRRISHAKPYHPGIGIDLLLPDGVPAYYAFDIGAEAGGSFSVRREECRIASRRALGDEVGFEVRGGKVVRAFPPIQSAVEPDRLALVTVSGLPEYRPVYDALCGMAFYQIQPEAIRSLQDPDPGRVLARDGRNLAALVRELARADGQPLGEICEWLATIVPGVQAVEHKALGPKETLVFHQMIGERLQKLYPQSMSDGTLRALGILTAIFQTTSNGARPLHLVAIEEPEVAIHPGATDVLAQALLAASERRQILLTSHSPDLLDHQGIAEAHLRAVEARDGKTTIGPVDEVARSALRDQLYTAGELLRMGQISPDESARLEPEQMNLFEPSP